MKLSLIYVAISLFSVLCNAVVASLCFIERKKHSLILAITCIGATMVQLAYITSVMTQKYLVASLFSSIYFVGIDITLISLFTFVRSYIKGGVEKRDKIVYFSIILIGLFDAIVLFFNVYKEIAVTYIDRGGIIGRYAFKGTPLYSVHLIFSYLLVAGILYNLIKRIITLPGEYKRPYVLGVHTLFGVVLLNAIFLYVPQLFGDAALDYSMWGYSIASAAMYYIFYRFPQKGMKAYYNSWIVANINQGVALFDYNNRLLIHNDKLEEILPQYKFAEGKTAIDFGKEFHLEKFASRNNDDYSFQHYIERDGRDFPIRLEHRVIRSKSNRFMGQLYVVSDDAGEVDLLTAFYSWEKFKQIVHDAPDIFQTAHTVTCCDIIGLGAINNKYGKHVGDQAIEILSSIVRDAFSGESYYIRGQEANLVILSFDITEEETRERLEKINTALSLDKSLGFSLTIQSAVGVVKEGQNNTLDVINDTQKAVSNKKLLDTNSRHSELITSLVKTLAECDDDTEAHVKRTQKLGEALGKKLGFSDYDLSNLDILCILHDIGKIGIPLEVLNKPGRLNDAEWAVMKTHVEKGYQIAMSSQEINHIADMILHHHESWDGRGYPDGFSKENIPLLSRVIAIVDAYDAMTNDRCYRKAMPIEDAIRELRRCAGTQFDPNLVKAFISVLPDFEEPSLDHPLPILKADSSNESDRNEIDINNMKGNVHAVNFSRYLLDENAQIIEVDSNFEKLTGYTLEEVKNRNLTQWDLLPEDDRSEYMRLVSMQLGQNGLAYFEHRLRRKNGSIAFVFCFGKLTFDATVKKERSEIIVFDGADTYSMQLLLREEMNGTGSGLKRWGSDYRCDTLTGLLNYDAMRKDIEKRFARDDSKMLFFMLDVDRFKEFNEIYGSEEADKFLVTVAQSLSSTLRKNDLACRIGEDEFAAVLFYEKEIDDDVMIDRAQQICDKLNFVISTIEGNLTISMGVALSNNSLDSFNKIYVAADLALYEAKESGRARMVVSRKSMI